MSAAASSDLTPTATCAVCAEDLCVPAFAREGHRGVCIGGRTDTAPASAAGAGAAWEATYRLPCGHAFHVECTVRALMAGTGGCPTCRAGQWVTGAGAGAGGAQGARDEDDDTWDADTDTSDDDMEFDQEEHERLRHQLGVVRCADDGVKRARASAREVRGRYNALRQELRATRRRLVSEALRALRRTQQRAWRRVHREYVHALRTQRSVEAAALRRRFGPDVTLPPATFYTPETYFVQPIVQLEPTQRRFWCA